jgi:type II secretory pathway component PulM
MVSCVLTQLNKVIESEKDSDHESSCSEGSREMVEESKDDLSLSLINQKIASSEESSQVQLDDVVIPRKVDHFKQTQLRLYGFER